MMGRRLVAWACTVVTVLTAAAAGLAWRLELSGMARPRDTEPRLAYLALLGLMVLGPAIVTIAAYRWARLSSWLVPAGLVVGSVVLFWGITGLWLG